MAAQMQVQPQAVPVPAVLAVTAGAGPESGGGHGALGASLYVGDLEENVLDSQLYDIFSQIAPVISVRVCRDMNSRRSLGYGYVNFATPADAARALEVLNFTPLNGKPIRVMYSNRDPSLRRSGTGNIFIKNLDKSIDNKALFETFSAFGNIVSCKVETDASGQSKGYGFVQYEQEDAAQNAINKLNGMLLNDKKVYVGPFVRKQERENTSGSSKFNNVFVKNLSESVTESTLNEVFGKYGAITSLIVMRDSDGKSKCFGFVNFESSDDAARAVEELNGKKFDDKEWYVGKAMKKSEREMELKEKFVKPSHETPERSQGTNLYLKNLDDDVGDDKLRELFSEYGTITSCKVMLDVNGSSKGSGFVAFQTAEEASRALKGMNGKMIGSKPLYVAVAQRKDERKARLQAQFSQLRPMVMPPPMGPRMPLYHPGVPGMGHQQPLHVQPHPAFINQQLAFGYQQHMIPGLRNGAAPMPNVVMPMVQQGLQPRGPGSRRVGAQHSQQNHFAMGQQQQMFPRGNRGHRFGSGRSMTDSTPHGMSVSTFPTPFGMGGIPVAALASTLANAAPDQQRLILGESLYPLVDQLEHDQAAKITGMLLEMDQTEVLHLLESPDALKAKVGEAIEVLRNATRQHQHEESATIDELTALSLNEGVVS